MTETETAKTTEIDDLHVAVSRALGAVFIALDRQPHPLQRARELRRAVATLDGELGGGQSTRRVQPGRRGRRSATPCS